MQHYCHACSNEYLPSFYQDTEVSIITFDPMQTPLQSQLETSTLHHEFLASMIVSDNIFEQQTLQGAVTNVET